MKVDAAEADLLESGIEAIQALDDQVLALRALVAKELVKLEEIKHRSFGTRLAVSKDVGRKLSLKEYELDLRRSIYCLDNILKRSRRSAAISQDIVSDIRR